MSGRVETMTSSFLAQLRGPLRNVVRELPRRVEKRDDYKIGVKYYYRYELSCGHAVERGQPRRTKAYCEECE